MFKNFFEARDELDRAILTDEITLAAQALAIFRFLLSHAFYDYEKYPERYGFVNRKVWGVDNIGRYNGCSERTARDHLTALQDAKLIHRQPQATWAAGRQDDEITIVWVTFHAPDIDSIPADLSDQPADSAVSFISTKNYKNDYNNTNDVVVATPSGKTKDRAKDSTRSEGTARSSSTARAGTRAKDESPVDGIASLEEYVSDLEGCVGKLEVRLFSEDDGQIDVPVLARKLRNLCIRYEFHCLWSDILRLVPVDDKWWWQAGNKEVPAGYLLRLIELDMIRMNKEKKTDELEDRLLELFNGREYLPGHRISELMPDVDPELTMMLSNRLLEEGVIKKHPTKINCFVLGTPRPVQDDAPVAVATPVKFAARGLADKIVTALARGQVREDYIAQRVNSDYDSIQPALELLVADGTITRSIKPEDSYYLYVLTEHLNRARS